MAAAVDTTNSPARWAGTPSPGGTITSGSFTAAADSFFVLALNCDGNDDASFANGVANPLVPSTTGGSALTWTKRVSRLWSEATTGGMSEIWTAPATTSVARTVTVTKDGACLGSQRVSAKLFVVTGVDLSGTPVDAVGASNEGGTNTDPTNTTNVTPGANGLLFVAATDWSQTGTGTSSNLTLDMGDYAGQITAWSGYRTCSSGVAVNGNLNPPATPQFKWCQIVVREAAGGAATQPPIRAFAQNTNQFLGGLIHRTIRHRPSRKLRTGRRRRLRYVELGVGC
jgi:hypothetical protein